MLEQPPVADEAILACVGTEYDLAPQALEFLPVGNDSTAFVYRLSVRDGRCYFLKLKSVPAYPPSLLIPGLMQQRGIEHMVPPLSNRRGQLSTTLGAYELILYAYIDGENGGSLGLTDSQQRELGAFVAALHRFDITGTPLEHMRRETFGAKYLKMFEGVRNVIEQGKTEDRLQRELAVFWSHKRADIDRITCRVNELGAVLRSNPPPFVLCHADIHQWNVLISASGEFWIVDWDETIVAPKERDLMFAGRPPQNPLFYEGYGDVSLNETAWTYYLYEWALQEIADYGYRVVSPDFGPATKRDALHEFQHQFAAGSIVEAAFAADAAHEGK